MKQKNEQQMSDDTTYNMRCVTIIHTQEWRLENEVISLFSHQCTHLRGKGNPLAGSQEASPRVHCAVTNTATGEGQMGPLQRIQ
mmetsp:Transcript_149356/g.260868  ORF Transcript_149356/g.260868 Transcript_149356/m.260868 type:complete len:84 (-) Transcript_149356:976-1227(-)